MAKTDKTYLNEAELEGLFAAARATTPEPSDQLVARIIAGAVKQAVPEPMPVDAVRPTPARRSLWAGFLAGIGGWPVLAGLATATIAGVWLGFAAPDTLDAVAGGVFMPGQSAAGASYQLEDLVPSFADFSGLLQEG